MYVIIIGCGRVGSELARLLADAGDNIVVVDKNSTAFKNLGSEFNGVTLSGDGFDVDLLKEAGIEQADLCSIGTDGCVLKTAVDLFEAGIRPLVLADFCASHGGPACHEAGLLLLRRFIGARQVVEADVAPETGS